ncbi:PQQ-dependent sugar dehydrogenase, partial [candidate division WWE3 bacterium]|nr:PQQ-dependent sugar dehydrogenase [candidate division WWE3 bacterium]
MEKKTIVKLATALLFLVTVLLGYFWNDVQDYVNLRIHPLPDIIVLTQNGNSPLSPPEGYSVQILASRLDQPRTMVIDPMDKVIAAIAGEGTIRVFTDAEQDTQSTVLLSDLNRPHGLALTCTDTCKLAIAESNKVTIWDYDPDSVSITSPQQIDNLDDSGTHYAKGVIFDPKNPNILYIFSGSTCNVCHETTPGRAAIQKVDVSEEPLEVTLFASGLRNSLFGAINPSTQEIWMTEISRDFLDGGLPPDEINILSAGNNYGWPQCYGNNVHDRDFDNNLYQLPKGMSICESYNAIPPHIELPAHVSPMGIVFTDASATLAKEYPYDALVAYHEGNGQPKIIKLDLDQAGNLEKIE